MTGRQRFRSLISATELARRIAELGQELTRDYDGRDLCLVSVLKGSFMFMADLCRRIDLPLSCEFLGRCRSYGDATTPRGSCHHQ